MGLKSKLNKMKNFLFDEEEEGISKQARIKGKLKEKKEEKDIIKKEKEDFDDLYFEDISEPNIDNNEIQSRVVKNENEFKFPEFNDDDFMTTRRVEEPIILKEEKREEKVALYQGSKRKEETKKFKPSPIISPIYGLLDSEGNLIKESSSDKITLSKSKEEMSLDDIRKKAYGKLDLELENTLNKLNGKTIEEAEKDMEKEEKKVELSRTKQKEKLKSIDPIVEKRKSDDDMILPNINFKEIDVDAERNKENKVSPKDIDDDEDDDTKEQDLFHLIDTMYSEKGGE